MGPRLRVNRTLIVNGDEQEDPNDTMAAYELQGIRTHQLFGPEPLRLPSHLEKPTLIASDRQCLRELEESAIENIDLLMNLRARLAELAPHFDCAVFDTAGANSRIANAFLIAGNFAVVPTQIDEHSIRDSVETIGRISEIRWQVCARVLHAQIRKKDNIAIFTNNF